MERLNTVLDLIGRIDFRFGVGRAIKALAGSTAADVLEKGLDDLPGYGAFKGEGEGYARELVQFLEDHSFLERESFQSEGRFGGGHVIGLSPAGKRLLRGELQPVLPPVPAPSEHRPRKRRSNAAPAPADVDSALYERLRRFRASMASEHAKPAYTFYSDQTLTALAAEPPANEDEFLEIKGLGPKKWASFGEALLEEVRGWREEAADAPGA